MNRMRIGRALVLALTTVVSCAAQRQAAVRMDTLNGAVVVRNPRQGVWRPADAWTVHEVFRLGGADGRPEELFSGPLTGVTLSPQGHTFVLDPQADDIRIFDGSGRFIRRIGGSGQGPGELTSPAAMGWDHRGQLWVANAFNGRYSVFDSTGGFLKTVPRAILSLARPQHHLVFDRRASFIDETPRGLEVSFVRVDTTGTVADTLLRLSHPPRPHSTGPLPPSFDRTAFEYLPRLVWSVAPDGTVWSATSGALRFVQQSLAGDTLRIVETQHRQLRISPQLADRLERELATAGLAGTRYTLVWPLVQSIHVLPDGHVLVQVAHEPGQPGHVLDVFDPEGRFLGSMELGFRMTTRGRPAFEGDTMVAVAIGDLDVPYVVRLTIRRPVRDRP